jgi:hypothetical protein
MRNKMRRRRRTEKTLNLFLIVLLRSLIRLYLFFPNIHESLFFHFRDGVYVDLQIRFLSAFDYLSLRNLADIDDLRFLNALLLLKSLLKQV